MKPLSKQKGVECKQEKDGRCHVSQKNECPQHYTIKYEQAATTDVLVQLERVLTRLRPP